MIVHLEPSTNRFILSVLSSLLLNMLLVLLFLSTLACSFAQDVPTASISTHVLDTANGTPAAQVQVLAYVQEQNGWRNIGTQFTQYNGRVNWVSPNYTLVPGVYKLAFRVEEYYKGLGQDCFYPIIEVTFTIKDATQHYHVPITLSPYGYSTYRGA